MISLHIYTKVADQLITAAGVPVGIMHSAIEAAMEREGVPHEDRRETHDRVTAAWHLVMEMKPEGDGD